MRSVFEKFGFTQEAVRKDAMLLNDGFVDGYDYALLESEWPSCKEKIFRYLATKT